ncbi:MAG: sugar ABC transporter ATP-binding protein, partial [Vallitaleaceae bacterium]|nr:sugar ABC transporter ATP-binding protein [Vallitaleaceae bacterium]
MLDSQVNLEFQKITMDFPGVRALEDISIKIQGGEITALMGENGAGKSTLLKILYGDYHPTEGRFFLNGQEKKYKEPHQAINDGISIIYQERQIVQYLSVAENVFMGKFPVKKNGLIDFRKLNKETGKLIDEFGLDIKPTERVKDLSIAHQQMVEIMKACNRSLRVIAFDEPTASLSDKEIVSLYKVIRRLKQEGKIIIYVSHRMKEIFEISDRIIVFKDGKIVDNV